MSKSDTELGTEFSPEPERYEFAEGVPYHFDLGRRDFFKVLGGGIVVLSLLGEAMSQERPGGGRRGGPNLRGPQEIGAWIHIGEDGTVTAYTGKVELGQNARTSLTQAVAEELRAPLSSIRLVMADTSLTPFDMGTFGSLTTPQMGPQIRRAAAAAREMLLELASESWKVDRGTLVAGEGKITNPAGNQSLDFGQLTKGQKLTKTVSADVPIAEAGQWRISGKSIPKVDGRAFVTGRHRYSADIKLPEMLHGKVLRPPAMGATLSTVDTQAAEEMAGVTVVHDGDFIGAAGPDEGMAARALAAIRAEWKTSAQPSGKELYAYLKEQANEARNIHSSGSIEQGLNEADVKLEHSYTIAYIAHAPLEPRAAVAEWKNDHLTVWTGSQRPFAVRDDLAKLFRIPAEKVRVIVPDTGSGYGGKQSSEMAIEAARLAKGANRPVKVLWTREEEFAWAYFRPAGVIEIRSGVRKDGTLTAWEFHNYNSGSSGIQPLYDIPHQQIAFHPSRSPLRQGSYRALAATANSFASESHLDELAHEVRMEPLEFRLKNLKDARLRGVFEAAANAFGWGKSKPASNHGFGIAGGMEKRGYVATCAEVSVARPSGEVQVERIVVAFDCGAVVNPDHLKNQIEGAQIMGLGGALFEEINFKNGKILNPKFSKYRVPRFSDTPVVEVVTVERKEVPSAGAGEIPMIALAPAIGNAIFDATRVRVRSMPMAPSGLKV